MIKELKINNLAIIKELKMELDSNFSTLTGETGAGKSIILDGISLILGSRSNVLSIRNGENKLSVEAIIELNDKNLEKIRKTYDTIPIESNELIIYREVTKDNKSKITINDKRVTLNLLKELSSNLVDIVGQHENQYLLNKEYHIDLLDAFLKEKENLSKYIKEIKDIEKEIEKLEEEKKNIIEKKDLYEFNIQEIEKLNLYAGMDKELEDEYKLIFNSGRIVEAYEKLTYEIDNGLLASIKKCIKSMDSISDLTDDTKEITNKLENIKENILDVYSDLSYSNDFSDSDLRLEKISDSLSKINKIKNKYKMNIENIIAYKDDMIEKLEKMTYSDDLINELNVAKDKIIEKYYELSYKLSENRKNIALFIEKEINKELKDLNMKEAEFKVDFKEKKELSENGIDVVEFLIRTNKGTNFDKLSKIASGGEISRIMLALKLIFSKVDKLETLIFDEIDAGISGETVKMVARKLKKLSKDIQLICVTHSPNIAILSDEQFLIEKNILDSKTETSIRKLNEEEKIEEIARIISGNNISEDLKNHIKNEIKKGKYE
ncbi:DNA repair protein RecN [Oceanivirga miroungae]|uniref:DNA repair protein RecN n=1 Tax=Oceanivirga miroungae TaxID=1130046 RepID=A0A6I8MDH9_9FUSO|nr:DNA repair protein RecN [Oceanivirga miroungae]VWL85150.1 DNA repair protein RecN [Oceanivirga miroungae]